MCGLHGIITNDTYIGKAEDFLKDAFIANQVRGMHSSGLFQVDSKGEIDVVKRAVNGSSFIALPEAVTALARAGRSKMTICHVRHRTSGEIKDENAHPFLMTREDGSKLVGVHNGSFENWRLKKDSDGVDVDSAWAFQMLANEGHDAFEYFSGAFALVWYDTRNPEIVNVARNDKRPFFYMHTKDGKTMLFASELGMLGWLAERNKLEPKRNERTNTNFLYTEPGRIYRFNIKDLSEVDSVEYPSYNPKTSKYVPPTPIYQGNYGRQHDRFALGNDYYGGDAAEWDAYGSAYPYARERTDWDEVRQANLFKNVKGILKAGRIRLDVKARGEDPATVLDAELIDEVNKELKETFPTKKENDQSVGPFHIGTSILKPDTTTVSKGERAAAERLQVFGQLVQFTGIMYDEDLTDMGLGSCDGTIRIMRDGQIVDADAALRGIPKRVANHRYIHAIRPSFLTVVGYVPPQAGLPEHFVVSEISEETRRLMLAINGTAANH